MAHPCIYCGTECYCSGDIDDGIVSKTPKNCIGCGCEDDGDHFDLEEQPLDDNCPICGREYDAIDREYQVCSHCQSEQQEGTETE